MLPIRFLKEKETHLMGAEFDKRISENEESKYLQKKGFNLLMPSDHTQTHAMRSEFTGYHLHGRVQ
jgi:hypothetical protein